jgi:hypothetical protein
VLNLSYCILKNFNHKHVKDITNINKGKKIVGMLWEKKQVSQRSIPKERTKFAFSSILHMWGTWGIDMQ